MIWAVWARWAADWPPRSATAEHDLFLSVSEPFLTVLVLGPFYSPDVKRNLKGEGRKNQGNASRLPLSRGANSQSWNPVCGRASLARQTLVASLLTAFYVQGWTLII